ncbi:MAG: apolipoprotein N-acyltransferase [Armatimonadota bacterium]
MLERYAADPRIVTLNVLLVVLSGILTSLLFPPLEWWWLAGVCLVPLLLALRNTTTVRAAGWLALLFGMVLSGGTLFWMWAIFKTGIVGIYVLVALPWVLFGLAYRMLSHRAFPLVIAMLTPVLWVAVEWLRCDGWYFEFSWLQLGVTFVPWHSGLHLYPQIGVYGVTFLIVLVNALLAALLMPSARGGRLLAPFAILLLGILLFSLNRPSPARQENRPTIIGCVVQEETGGVDRLIAITKQTAKAGTNLIVWPEYAVPAYLLSEPRQLAEMQQVAREAKSTLVLGCKEHAPADAPCDWLRRRAMTSLGEGLFFNTALVLGPDGEVLGTYHKTHPIQFFADGVPGGAFNPIQTPVGKMGVAICYDFDYASTAFNLVRNGAEVLVVPTFDQLDWGAVQHTQHSRIAQARAAEVSRWTLRATSSGISQIITPNGELTASLPYGQSAAITGSAGLRTEMTPYVRFGYLLPAVCLGISVLWLLSLLVGLVTGRRKTEPVVQEPVVVE